MFRRPAGTLPSPQYPGSMRGGPAGARAPVAAWRQMLQGQIYGQAEFPGSDGTVRRIEGALTSRFVRLSHRRPWRRVGFVHPAWHPGLGCRGSTDFRCHSMHLRHHDKALPRTSEPSSRAERRARLGNGRARKPFFYMAPVAWLLRCFANNRRIDIINTLRAKGSIRGRRTRGPMRRASLTERFGKSEGRQGPWHDIQLEIQFAALYMERSARFCALRPCFARVAAGTSRSWRLPSAAIPVFCRSLPPSFLPRARE